LHACTDDPHACTASTSLYFAIKDINDAGHALHADNLEESAKDNLKELYRRVSPRPAPAPVVPQTTAATK
jgi:hypothetical protein